MTGLAEDLPRLAKAVVAMVTETVARWQPQPQPQPQPPVSHADAERVPFDDAADLIAA
ncbi:hypothetical protein [Streptomyces sp. WG-D5]